MQQVQCTPLALAVSMRSTQASDDAYAVSRCMHISLLLRWQTFVIVVMGIETDGDRPGQIIYVHQYGETAGNSSDAQHINHSS